MAATRAQTKSAPKPLSQRPGDWVYLAFFLVNLPFIVYFVDMEQLVIADPNNFEYPLFPPKFMVDIVHSYAREYDPVILARPVWWKVTIWWDSLFFGPFYAFAIYAFVKGRNWIRLPAIVYSSVILTILSVILSEETWGPNKARRWEIVMALNAPWAIIPFCLLVKMLRNERPFDVDARKAA